MSLPERQPAVEQRKESTPTRLEEPARRRLVRAIARVLDEFRAKPERRR